MNNNKSFIRINKCTLKLDYMIVKKNPKLFIERVDDNIFRVEKPDIWQFTKQKTMDQDINTSSNTSSSDLNSSIVQQLRHDLHIARTELQMAGEHGVDLIDHNKHLVNRMYLFAVLLLH